MFRLDASLALGGLKTKGAISLAASIFSMIERGLLMPNPVLVQIAQRN